MSFTNLRAARQAKRSFVASEPEPKPSNTASASNGPPGADVEMRDESSVEKPRHEVVDLDGLHRSLPRQLEVRKTDYAGRGVYATRDFRAGSVLLAMRPHISVLSTPHLDAYCSFCCGPAPATGLKRCTRCRSVHYCGTKCQNADWAMHKSECVAMQSWASAAPSADFAVPSDAIRCLGRILWTAQKEGFDSTWAREIHMMQSHRASLPPSAADTHTHLAHSLIRYLGVSSPAELQVYGLSSAGDLVDFISRFTTNTFTLTSYSLAPIGVAVCPTIALVNHSCEPNAVIVFPRASSNPHEQEPLMHLIAIKDIGPDEEVLGSYVDITLPQDLRRKELKETYYFDCECSLCSKRPALDPRESMWCPKSCGGMCPVPTEENSLTRCVKCKAPVSDTDTVIDAVRVGQEALAKATFLQTKDPSKTESLTRNMIPILTSARLTPSSHPLPALHRLRLELLITTLSSSLTQATLDEAIRIAAIYSTGLSGILVRGHPVRGVALAELGKLLAVDESEPASSPDSANKFPPSGPARLRLAEETLVRARDELVVGFGQETGGGAVAREVRESLVRLEKELGAWTQGVRNVREDEALARAGGSRK